MKTIIRNAFYDYCTACVKTNVAFLRNLNIVVYKHLKKSNAACFYTPIVLKLLIIVQM